MAEKQANATNAKDSVNVKLNPALDIRGYTFADGFHIGGQEVKAVSSDEYEQYKDVKVNGSQVVIKA